MRLKLLLELFLLRLKLLLELVLSVLKHIEIIVSAALLKELKVVALLDDLTVGENYNIICVLNC